MEIDTVIIIGEELEISIFEEVKSFTPIGPSQPLSPISRRSVRHTKITVMKRLCDGMAGYPINYRLLPSVTACENTFSEATIKEALCCPGVL